MEKMKKSAFSWLIGGMSLLLVLAIGLTVASVLLKTMASTYLGTGRVFIKQAKEMEGVDADYYRKSFSTKADSTANGERVTEKLCEEGFVLLKNNGALPLSVKDTAVSLIGRGAVEPVYGGSGSGNVDASKAATPYSGLKRAGFDVDGASYQYFKEQSKNYSRCSIKMDDYNGSQWLIGEVAYTDRTGESKPFTVLDGAAIYVISRGGGEGWDLSSDLKRDAQNSTTFAQTVASGTGKAEYETYEEGQHQLELSAYEKNWLAFCEKNYEKTVVVINSSNAMELGDLKNDDGVDAVLWVGGPGSTGFNAMGSILSGKVNPSGRTADIYPADFTADPTFPNTAAAIKYTDIGAGDVAGGDSGREEAYFTQYEEGIYLGYRYYETASDTGVLDYDKAVVYPFGYGLSYTTFEKTAIWEEDETGITVSVTVKNTGTVPGKEVVELYYNPPYTAGGIEKASVNLGDFAKTDLIRPGERDTVSLRIDKEEMASYDYKGVKIPGGGFVLESGDYVLSVRDNSHDIAEGSDMTHTFHLTNDVKYTENKTETVGNSTVERQAAKNRFNDLSAMFKDEAAAGYARNMSRADFVGSFPTVPTEADSLAKQISLTYEKDGKEVTETVADGLKVFDASKQLRQEGATMPETNKKKERVLSDMRGLSYDDPVWDEYLNQLTEADYKKANEVLMDGAYNTAAIESLGKHETEDYDGPQGFSSLWGSTGCCAYCSEVIIASTWNKEAAADMGVAIGEESLTNGLSGWYGPAMNIHRSPFSGRNFEYYSEDPVLSGKIGCSVVEGAASKGCYGYIKHFALNDSEVMRTTNLCTWVNEQAMREIYLAPFRYVVENARAEEWYIADETGTMKSQEVQACTAVMSSFNRLGGTWAGGSYPLMTEVLRDEWGFRGLVISDFNLYNYMDADQGVRAGTDLQLTWAMSKGNYADTNDAVTRQAIRKAYKNMCYTVANSNAMQGVAPGGVIAYGMAWWQVAVIVFDIIAGVLIVSGIIRIAYKKRMKKE